MHPIKTFACSLVLGASIAPAPAWAQDSQPDAPPALQRDPKRASDFLQEGLRLQLTGKIDQACGSFARSQAFDPQAQTLLNLALCHEKQGKLATAWGELRDAASLFSQANNKERATYARTRASELEPRLSMLVLAGVENTKVETLTIDGQDVPRPTWSAPIPLDPGEHALVFLAVGAEPRTVKVQIPGGAARVPLAIPALTKTRVGDVQEGAPPYLGYGLIGGGAVGLGLGTVFGIMTLSASSDAKAACDAQNRCSAEGLERVSDGRTSGTISTVGFVVGALLAGAGVYLIVTHQGAARSGLVETLVTGRGTF